MKLPIHSYNPSLCLHNGKRYLTVRDHDRGDWRSNLYVAELDEQWNVISCQPIMPPLALRDNSHEDARIFSHDGKLKISWTCSQYPATQFRCAVGVGELLQNDAGWSVGNYFFPKFGRNDFTGMEKNFAPFVVNGELHLWYGIINDEQIILRMAGGNVQEVMRSKALPWGWGPCHGGAICHLPNGNLAHILNTRTGQLAVSTHRYHCTVAELSPSAPFQMLRISRRPVLYGEEGCNLDGYRWWKGSVVFCCGALCEGADLMLAIGWNDAKARLVKLKPEHWKL